MCDALGIINFEDACVDITGLMDYRPASAISFLGRYRLIDFMLSNMTNSGISQIEVFIKDKPRSLIEHLGNGRQYNINSKRGRLSILYGENRIMSISPTLWTTSSTLKKSISRMSSLRRAI